MCRNAMCSMGRALVVSVALVSTASAGLIAYDGFSYDAGTNLDGASGGTGWSSDWSLASTGGTVTAAAPGMSFGALPVEGNKALLTPTTDTTFLSRTFPTVNSGTLYLGMLANKTDDGTRFFGINLQQNGTERQFFGHNSGVANWSFNGGASHFSHDTPDPTLLVFAVDFDAGQYRLYVNPRPGGPEPVVPHAHASPAMPTGINGIGLGAGFASGGNTTSTGWIDEVRIATTWADAVPARAGAERVVIYREIFPNNTTSDLSLTEAATGWEVYRGDGKRVTHFPKPPGENLCIPGGGGATYFQDAPPINSDPNPERMPPSQNGRGGYLWNRLDANHYLHWTDEYTVDQSARSVLSFSTHVWHDQTGTEDHLVVRIDDQWFYTLESHPAASTGHWRLNTWNFSDVSWATLDFDPVFNTETGQWDDSSTFEITGVSAALPEGHITAFGILHPNKPSDMRLRYSDFIITVPEPSGALLLVLGVLSMALMRQRGGCARKATA